MTISTLVFHNFFYFQNEKRNYLAFDVSKHPDSKAALKQLETEIIEQQKTNYESAVISVVKPMELCGYRGKRASLPICKSAAKSSLGFQKHLAFNRYGF